MSPIDQPVTLLNKHMVSPTSDRVNLEVRVDQNFGHNGIRVRISSILKCNLYFPICHRREFRFSDDENMSVTIVCETKAFSYFVNT